jgi:hypothetical protein
LSEGQASTISNEREVGQGLPSLSLPRGGMTVKPDAMPVLAAANQAWALHQLTCPKTSPCTAGRPLTQSAPFSTGELLASNPLTSRSCKTPPLKPNQRPTTAPAGSVGTTGGAAGAVPSFETRG